MSRLRVHAGGTSNGFPRLEPHSLHGWQEHPDHGTGNRLKPDRFFVGFLAGAALFYLFGRAMGLGKK